MTADTSTHFRALDASEIRAILERNGVGRMAYLLRDQVDVLPMHYVYNSGWIYGRTSPGEKLTALDRDRWVTFEVDEIQGPFDWRSVVVHGGFYPLTPGDVAWDDALRLLRTRVSETLTRDDPAPFRTVLFRIAVQECTGREAVAEPQDESNPSRRAILT